MIAKACKEIAGRNLDDTFYLVDLANVLRMFKVPGREHWAGLRARTRTCTHTACSSPCRHSWA